MLTLVSSSSSDDDDEEESESDESDEDEESELEDELSFPSAFRFAFSLRANSSFSFWRRSFFISFVRDCLKIGIIPRASGNWSISISMSTLTFSNGSNFKI